MHSNPPPASNAPSRRGDFLLVLKVLYAVLFASVVFYWVVQELVAADREPKDLGVLKLALLVAAGSTAVVVFYLRFSRIPPLLSAPTLEPGPRLAQLRTYYIVCFALGETIALFGFVLRILGGSRVDSLPFYFISVVFFLLSYPRAPEATGPYPGA